MEPFRALVADKLPNNQRSYGFVMQTLIIGIGTWVASNLPWMVNKLGFSDDETTGIVPMYVKIAFAIGAMVFLISILYTIFTTKEYPPEDLEAFRNNKKETNFFKVQDHPTEGKLMYTNFPVDFNFDSDNKSLHAPNLGEHTDEILCELGYSDIEIKKLVSEGVIKLFNQK